jgi:deoxyribodipyrimidine photo-lyase
MPDGSSPVIVWFREDLRVGDHPALCAALESGRPVLALFILDETAPHCLLPLRPHGGASRWWLHHALAALDTSLRERGARLDILHGDALDLVPALARAAGAPAVFWSWRVEPAARARDSALRERLEAQGIRALRHDGALLHRPWVLKTGAGGPFRVWTPFWRALNQRVIIEAPLPAPTQIKAAPWPAQAPERVSLEALALLPRNPDWAGGLRATWMPGEAGGIGEAGAQARLEAFLAQTLAVYRDQRDRPDKDATSRLSAHLRWGELSPRQIWHKVKALVADVPELAATADKFLAELAWREFSAHLLFHYPDLAQAPLNPRFAAFAWRADGGDDLIAWQKGLTGYPLVDAGMRELWQTGTMHNRVRMVVASFLIKHLMIDWRQGERWFWDTLCDADPANNAASWQWVAGCGADAAPWFRIFNPVLQGVKFDPEGSYVRTFVPALRAVPAAYIHTPWTAPPMVLAQAGVTLGQDYPHPIVDHSFARNRALAALAKLG